MPQKMAVTVGFLLAGGILDAQIVTTTALASVTPAAPLFGQAVTLTAQVTPAGAPGTVAFMDGGVLVGVGTLNTGGIAQMTTITLPSGTHLLRAVYGGGTGGYLASQSAAQSYVVTAAAGAGFAPSVNYSTGLNPYSVAVGDFNGDGKADLAVTNYLTNNVSVLLGNGDGTFGTAVNYGAESNPQSVAVGDFDADGKADLAVAQIFGGVSVRLGNGNGTFQAAVNYDAGSGPSSLAVGDFNGDSKADLVVANAFSNNVSVLLGNGDGTFQAAVNYNAGTGLFSVAVGDFNGDGIADLALANYPGVNNQPGVSVSVLLGNGDGTFRTAVDYNAGTFTEFVAVGDFNGDGKADLAVANALSDNVSVLLGNGDGTFQAAVNYGVGSGPTSVAVGDFDGDGKADLAVANEMSNNLSVLFGNGDGTFQVAVNYSAGAFPLALAVGDFNGDGKADLAVANFSGNNVGVLLGASPVAVPNAVGLPQAAATSAITGVGLAVGTVTTAPSNSVPAGNVISENPAAGTLVSLDSAVNLVVSVGPPVPVPNVVGFTQAVATTVITGVGLTVGTVTTAFSNAVAPGNVISENPAAGTPVSPDSGVNLVVSVGPPVPVPNVVGFTQAAATTAITGVGLTVGTVTTAFSNAVAAGNVISENPAADTPVSLSSLVNLVVSMGPSVSVPNVQGFTQAAATSAITGIGLVLGTVTTAPSNSVPVGNVIGEAPAAGTLVSPGSAVNLVVSIGPPVSVPNVVGFTQAAATSAITGVGLALGTVTMAPSNSIPAGNVISEAPAAGALVSPGSVVNLVVSSGPPASVPNVVGFTQAAAGTAITGSGLAVGMVTTAWSNTVAAGNVINENPAAGTLVNQGSAVNLVISGAAPISVGPSSGSGLTQTFTFTFNAPDGVASLSVVDVLINNFLDGRNACYIAFVPSGASSGSVFLVDDAGDSGGNYTGMALPGTSTVQNSQCSIAGTGSSISASGNTLTLMLAITFQAPFAGDKVVYMATQDMTLTSSGWHPLGTWNVPGTASLGPWVSGVTSASGTSATQSLVFTLTDTNGFADISVVDVLINNFLDGIGACYVAYVPEVNAVLLVDDAGDAGGPYAGAFLLPGPGTASNSQCTVNGAASSVSGSGNTLTLTLNITFNHNFAGDKVIYAAARSNLANSGWLAVGTASVP